MIPTTIFYSDPLCRVIRKRPCEVDLHARTEPHSRHAIFFIHSGSQVKNIVLNIILYSTIKRILSFATRDQRWKILVHFSAQDTIRPSLTRQPFTEKRRKKKKKIYIDRSHSTHLKFDKKNIFNYQLSQSERYPHTHTRTHARTNRSILLLALRSNRVYRAI